MEERGQDFSCLVSDGLVGEGWVIAGEGIQEKNQSLPNPEESPMVRHAHVHRLACQYVANDLGKGLLDLAHLLIGRRFDLEWIATGNER
jgi:hypothetical protein